MNTNINFQLFRAVAIGAFMFFAFAENALAAPILTPATATQITTDSVKLSGFVSNHYKNSTVWLELSESPTMQTPRSYAVQGIWHEGKFEWTVRDLAPAQSYYFRSAALEGGDTVYSGTSMFTTTNPNAVAPRAVVYEKPTIVPVPTPIQKVTQVKTKTVIVEKVKNETEAQPTEEGFNNNSAAVIGVTNSALPTTLLGWLALLVAILAVVLIARMIYDTTEDRHREREERRRNEEFLAMQQAEKKENE